MKKTIIVLSLPTIILLLLLGGLTFEGNVRAKEGLEVNVTVKERVTVGYCPTMADLAKETASKNSHVSLQAFDYTAQALNELNKGSVDLVLVGRLAENDELDNAFEKRLRQGLTLAGREKRLIHVSRLKNNRIHTSVDEQLAREYLQDTENILFYDSVESAIREGINEIVLIDWRDYAGGLALVIPVDDAGNKIEKFRIPVIYSYNQEKIQDLEV